MATRYCKNGHEYGMRKKPWANVTGNEEDLEHCDKCGKVILAWGIRDDLIDAARKGQTLTYSEVYNRRWVGSLLGEISLYEYVNNRPLLTAIVVHKIGRKPGGGFFALPGVPEEVKRRGSEKENTKLSESEIAYWESEKNRVYDYWQSK